MKKYILTGAVIFIFAGYAMYLRFKSKSDTYIPVLISDQSGNSSGNESTNPNTGDAPTPSPTPVTTVQYKNGSYTGKVVDAFYGLLQVKAVISGGKLTDVVFLQYPNDREESIHVNSASNPRLRAEAIMAQSANVDIVSGATQSSEAFQKSLADALAQAI